MITAILRPPPIIARMAFFAVLFGAWEWASRMGMVSRFIAPPPSEVVPAISLLYHDNELVTRFLRTFGQVFAASGIGAGLGMIIGWWLHQNKNAGRAFTDWFAAIAAAPLVLLFPLFLVLFGRNASTIIAMGAVAVLPPIILKTKEGLDHVPNVLINVGRTFNLTRWQHITLIMMPASLPTIFTGLRLGLVFALINVVGVEYLIGFGGMGLMIAELGDRFEVAGMYAAILFVVLCSACFFWFTARLETWLLQSR
jgi:ABC-type nitrate/sulfonate/bicarbonate transport system permease component